MKFEIPEDKVDEVRDWIRSHECNAKQTAIGGKIKYSFIPTGLGSMIKVSCVCGKFMDVDDSDNW